MLFIKRHKKLFTFSILAIIMVTSALVGFIFAKNEPRINEDIELVLPVDVDDAKISESAIVNWDYEYKMCCHHIFIQCQIDENMVGLTFSQLQETYPEVRIVSYDADKLTLKKTFDCYCPEHFILKQYNKQLAIFRTAFGTAKQEVYIEVPISFDEIDYDERKVLSVGKVFNGLDDIESYLENIET